MYEYYKINIQVRSSVSVHIFFQMTSNNAIEQNKAVVLAHFYKPPPPTPKCHGHIQEVSGIILLWILMFCTPQYISYGLELS